jgi:RHS repeat-associated protein
MALYPGTAALKPRVHPGNQDNLSRTHSGCLYWYRSRHYDPGAGRFGQADKWGESLFYPSINHPYVYVDNSPTIYFDPIGTATFLTTSNGLPTYKELERSLLNDSVFIWQGHGNISTSDKGFISKDKLKELIAQRNKPFSLAVLAACGTERYTSEGLFSTENAKSVIFHKFWKEEERTSFFEFSNILDYFNDILYRNNSSNLNLTETFVKKLVNALEVGKNIGRAYDIGYAANLTTMIGHNYDLLPILKGNLEGKFQIPDGIEKSDIKIMPNYSIIDYMKYNCK